MTPEQLVTLTEAVNSRIYQLVKGILVPENVTSGERVPKIYDRLIVDSDHRAWANVLKSDRHIEHQSGEDLSQVHSVMIYPRGIRDYPGNTVRSMHWILDFGIDNFYQDYPGTTSDNPASRQNREIILVAAVLWSARPFGVEGVKQVVGFRESRVLSRLGDTMVRQSMSVCAIQLQPGTIPNP